ncbi:methyltransferase-like protein 23 [Erpetoichthys calabaricus]|uniref:Methyltransferase 23, arginine n=1 Tax=Erpetoichthys calabaricus TaxID=27687 RepID=A0A8C4SWV8_ERPCA|nr:methyltransferase-like protein 23 [Erpetoichthys calabaricus]
MCDIRALRRHCKDFYFKDDDRMTGSPGHLYVRIPEVLDPHYSMYVWPCAVVLAQYVWYHKEHVIGKGILEIGAGVGLPGVVAAKCGAKVILSDSARFPACLENSQRSCEANGLSDVVVLGITWGQVSPELLDLPQLDIVLGSDVFFEPEDFEDVMMTIYFLLKKNPKAQFWATYQERSSDWSIEAILQKWDLRCVHVPLELFNANKECLAQSNLPGRHSVQMIIITLKDTNI